MSRWLVALAVVCLCVPAVAPTTGAAPTPRVVGVYPDPVAGGDAGEFFVVEVPPGTDLSELTLDDGESTVRGPPRTAGGDVLLSTDADATRELVERPVFQLRGRLALSNAGERVVLRRDGVRLDTVRYPDSREGHVWDGEWRPLGASGHDPLTVSNASTTAFLLPDAAGLPLATVESADRRLYVAGYTFTSARVAAALRRAARRGVDAHLLVEGGPVGGVDPRQRVLLDRLRDAGVNVTVVDGPRARFRYHHAKYAVVDDRALVTSENWGPGGTGGGNRGWGAVVESAALADHLAELFARDAGWRDGRPPANASVSLPGAGRDSYPSRFDPVTANASVSVFAAPEDAGRGIRQLLRSAEESLLVQQLSIDRRHRFLNATVAAARRGVRVRVLLSGKWYVREENRRVVERLNRLARREGLPLVAKLAEPRSRYELVHVKGVVVDGERTLVGSVNWNDVSVTRNREVALVVGSERIAGRFERAFRADWRGGAWRIHTGTLLAIALAAVVTVRYVRRRVTFSAESPPAGRRRARRRPSSRRARREPPPASRERT